MISEETAKELEYYFRQIREDIVRGYSDIIDEPLWAESGITAITRKGKIFSLSDATTWKTVGYQNGTRIIKGLKLLRIE